MTKLKTTSPSWLVILTVAVVETFLMSAIAHAGPTRVGNGDDGRDLESIEGTEPVTSGVLAETRAEAVALLRSLNIGSVEGLGF
jgi:hypothetical protein